MSRLLTENRVLLRVIGPGFENTHGKYNETWPSKNSIIDIRMSACSLSLLQPPSPSDLSPSIRDCLAGHRTGCGSGSCFTYVPLLNLKKEIEKWRVMSDYPKEMAELRRAKQRIHELDLAAEHHLLTDGDENTRFFHGFVNNKKNKNRINRLVINRVWNTNVESLLSLRHIISHPRDRFTREVIRGFRFQLVHAKNEFTTKRLRLSL
ncbi:hypothetical protein LXL04_008795 [Taraxacum kok-saghyz]